MDAIVFAVLFAIRLRDRRRGALLVQRARGGRGDLAFARRAFRATRSIRWCA